MKTVRGVLRPAFQMAVDDDVLYKNPFGFELAGVVVNDSVTGEALTRDQMRSFLNLFMMIMYTVSIMKLCIYFSYRYAYFRILWSYN